MTAAEKLSPSEMLTLQRDRVDTSAHYLENALDLAARGEDRKAAELLWGSTAQMVKAAALLDGIDIRSHSGIREYVKSTLAPADPSWYTRFREIEGLHHHFYDKWLDPDDVQEFAGKVDSFVRDLKDLIDDRSGPEPSAEELARGPEIVSTRARRKTKPRSLQRS